MKVAIKKIGNSFDKRIDAKRTMREIKLVRPLNYEMYGYYYFVFPYPNMKTRGSIFISQNEGIRSTVRLEASLIS